VNVNDVAKTDCEIIEIKSEFARRPEGTLGRVSKCMDPNGGAVEGSDQRRVRPDKLWPWWDRARNVS
jgi:hypothetical protein